MIRVLSAFVVLVFSVAVSAFAQTVVGDRFRLNTGPCVLMSGSGSPEGVVAATCGVYIDTTTDVIYSKWTGTGTTGWGVGHNTNATVNGTILVTGAATLSSTLAVTSNTNLSGYVGVPGFVSQTTGWRVDNLGGADFRNLFTDELHAKVFIADLEQALAGGQRIAHSVAILANAFTCPALGGATTLTVEDLPGAPAMQVFQSGDSVVVRQMSRGSGELFFSDCIGSVSSPVTPGGTQSWSFARYAAPNGGSTGTGGVTAAKGLAIDYGTGGNGYYEVNAIDGVYGINSPYMQIVTWTVAPTAANSVLRARLGNLRGITGVTDEYGAILGTYGATGSEQYLRASSTAFETHNLNVSMYSGATEVIKLDRTAPSLAIGSAVPTAYGTGTGIWMGNDGGTYKFRAGIPNGAGLFWDGATLTVRGTAGSSTNMFRNSECRVGTEDWSAGYTTATPPTLTFNLASWRLNDVSSTCYLTEAGTPANGTGWFLATSDSGARFPVVAGSRYEASVYLGLHRVSAGYQFIEWFDSAGVSISNIAGNACTTASAGGLYLSGYCRSGVVATAPAGAVSALTYILGAHDGTGANPFMFAVRSFFGEATSTQTLLSEWGPAGTTEITGGLIRTGTIVAGHIAANTITAAKIAAGTITATEIAANTITAAKIAAGTITATEIAAATITAAKIAAGTITGTQIAGTTITGGHIAGGTITSGNITDGTIAGGDIASTTITGGNIATGTITADRLSVSTLSAITADLGAVTAGSINVSGGGGAFSMTSNGDVSVNTLTVATNLTSTLVATFNNGISIPSGGFLWGGATGGLGGERYVCISNDGTVHTSTVACN